MEWWEHPRQPTLDEILGCQHSNSPTLHYNPDCPRYLSV